MNALLLAAGYATRLYPLTRHTPKPLLTVAGKPIAQYMVEQLEPIPAIHRLLVVTNHRFARHFQEWAATVPCRFTIEVVDDGTDTNETRLGAIGDIAFTLQRFPDLGNEPLFVLGGDNLVDFRLADLVDDYQRRNHFMPDANSGSAAGLTQSATVVCLVHTTDPAQLRRSGVATLDETGRITSFVEKPAQPQSDLTCPPFYVFPPAVLQLVSRYLEAGESPDAPGNFVAWLHQHVPVYGHVFEAERYDVGTPESYAEVSRLFEARAANTII